MITEFLTPPYFKLKGGWVGQCFSPPGGFEMGWLLCHLFLVCGGIQRAMDGMILAEAFRLGVKKSSIKLPWEREPFSEIFGKRQRLICPPAFVPMPSLARPDDTLAQTEVAGKVTWTKVTSVIPWPTAQERALGRALENWRIILMDNLDASVLGRQISSILDGTVQDFSVEQVIRDLLSRKSVSTLRSRASSLMAFARWKKSLDEDSKIFPICEEDAYRYVVELRQLNAPRTKPSRFLESLAFAHHMIGADVGNTLFSPRLKGAVVSPVVVPKKKTPLALWQVAAMENIAINGLGQEAIFAGYVCMVLHARLRWSDGQYCQEEPHLDLHNGSGFLECELYHHKNAGRQKQARRLLPAACCIPGIYGDWATPWLDNRCKEGLRAMPGMPTMPAPLAGGNWALVPLEPSQATVWLREIFTKLRPGIPVANLGTHSLKATLLSWMAKCCCPESIRRLAGYHVDPASKSALEYSRDAQAPVLHAVEGIYMIISQGLFRPDESRARRWSNPACKSLQDAMNFLAGSRGVQPTVQEDGYEPESPLDAGWEKIDSDGEVSISSISSEDGSVFQRECNTSGEDQEAEVSAPIVGASLAQDLHYSLHDVNVFRHLKSGCCHIAKDSAVIEEDGEVVVLRCGKLAPRNFEKVEEVGNFMPYKCTRCVFSVAA